MRRRPAFAIWALMVSGVGALPAAERASFNVAAKATYAYQRVADTTTKIPGAAVQFGGFYTPALNQGRVVFRAYGPNGPDFPVGVYRWSVGGPVELVVDTGTNAPGGLQYATFGNPVIEGDDIVFGAGFTPAGSMPLEGIYRSRTGRLTTLIDTSTTIPGSGKRFTQFYGYAYSAGELACVAQGTDEDEFFNGLLRVSAPGQADIVVDTDSTVPGEPRNPYWLFQASLAYFGRQIAYTADNNFQTAPMTGVFLADGGSTTTVLNRPYTFFRSLSASPRQLAFCEYDTAIYRWRDGVLTQPVIAFRDRLPDSIFPLSTIGAVAVAGDAWAYTGTFRLTFTIPSPLIPILIEIPIQSGLYADFGSGSETVLSTGVTLEGRKVRTVAFGPNSFSGNQFVCTVEFVGGGRAIYLATRQSP